MRIEGTPEELTAFVCFLRENNVPIQTLFDSLEDSHMDNSADTVTESEFVETPAGRPARWTGVLVGEIHNAGLTIKQVAAEAGMNPKYVSQVLNSEEESKRAEEKLRTALNRLIERNRKSKETEYST